MAHLLETTVRGRQRASRSITPRGRSGEARRSAGRGFYRKRRWSRNFGCRCAELQPLEMRNKWGRAGGRAEEVVSEAGEAGNVLDEVKGRERLPRGRSGRRWRLGQDSGITAL